MGYASMPMKTRFLSLLLAFALLINFSGMHAWAAEVGGAITDTYFVYSDNAPLKSGADPGCAMHERDAAPLHHSDDKTLKTGHVCGSLECDCGCHINALTFAAIGIAGASHAAKLAMFQPQRVPLTPIKLSLRPPILA